LVSNWTAALQDFDPALATSLLSRARHRHAAANKLARIARRQGWDGITIDLEAMQSRDRKGLVALVRELRTKLPAGCELSVDIGARSTIGDYRRSGFALRIIARHVDRIVLMVVRRPLLRTSCSACPR
jgi:spore germination protein